MSLRPSSDNVLQKSILFLAVMAVPVFAGGQHKPNPPAQKPSAPAPHASAPRPSAPKPSAPQHGASNQQRGPGNQQHGASNQQHGSTPNGPNARGGANAHGPNSGGPNAKGPNNGANARGPNGKGPNNGPNAKGPNNGANARGPNGKGPNNGPNAKGANGRGPNGGPNARGSRTPPGRQVSLKGGGSARIRPNGQIRSVNRNGMHIEHGIHGGRRIESTRNGARVVTVGRHGGYVQRNYVSRNGRTYVSRTYVVNNVSYTSVYRSYGYGGYCCYYGYAPAYYYNPGYYGWAYNPWPAPAYYNWGWGGSPWYGYYGPYYQPYPVYPSAAFWLTDYLLAASLQAAYAAQMEANAELVGPEVSEFLVASLAPPVPAADAKGVALSAEAKQAVADEVKAQIADEQAEAGKKGSPGGTSDAPPPALDPKRKTFVVSTEVTLVVDGDECSLTAGDVITRTSETPDEDRNVTVKVLASKKADCAVGSEGAVAVDDLQEMHNKFREQLTGGMGELAKKQGKDGLPKAPDTSTTDGEVPAPPADKTAAKTLEEQQGAADQTETQVKQEAANASSDEQQ